MSKRKYIIEKPTAEELETIAEKFPTAIETIVTRKLKYGIVSKLLDCGVEIPGLRLAEEPKPSYIAQAKEKLEDGKSEAGQ